MKQRTVSVSLFCLLLLLSLAAQAQWKYGPPPRRPVVKAAERILVRFRPAKSPDGARRMQALRAQGSLPALDAGQEIPGIGVFVYRLADPRRMQTALTSLRRMPEVLYAEPAHRILLLSNPNDPYFNATDTTHALFPPDAWPYQWPLQFIQAADAWTVWPGVFYTSANKPRNALKVAVIDTGIDLQHPDFINAGGTSNDARNGGQLDLADARNMLNGGINPTPTDPSDEFGHGTHVSGIIGAATNNGQGIAALGYPAQVMPIKVTDPSGDGDDADVVAAMIWAADHGAQVINLSLALNGGYSQALQDAVNYCWLKNTLVVAAAGNDGVDYVRRYPAACNKVLAVGATVFASADTIPDIETNASYSNMGLYVGIAAPGGDASYWSGGELGLIPELYTLVWSTTPTEFIGIVAAGITEQTYGYLNGTSMASPHVAALAALYAGYKGFTQNTTNAPKRIVKALQQGAVNLAGRLDGGWTPALGHGRIDALATMQETFGAGRDATTPGCITGQVTFYGTPVLNAAITAIRTGTTFHYGASSKEDGTFRIANLPPGSYNVSCQYFGIIKTATVTVEAACDAMATDFEMDESPVSITLSPHLATVPIGGTQQFTATVSGSTNTIVLWSILDGPGSITSDGMYLAPTITPTVFTAHVQARSLADPAKTDVAEITIPASALLRGSVTLPSWSPPNGTVNTVRVFLFPAGSSPALESQAVATADVPLDNAGNFTVTTSQCPEGTYRVGVRPLNAPALARLAAGNVVLSAASPPTLNPLTCPIGDVSRDGLIDDVDLSMVILGQGTTNAVMDVNGDGLVDDVDLSLVIFNQGLMSDFLP